MIMREIEKINQSKMIAVVKRAVPGKYTITITQEQRRLGDKLDLDEFEMSMETQDYG